MGSVITNQRLSFRSRNGKTAARAIHTAGTSTGIQDHAALSSAKHYHKLTRRETRRLGPWGRGRHSWAWEIEPPGSRRGEAGRGKTAQGAVIGLKRSANPDVIWVTGLIRGCCRLRRAVFRSSHLWLVEAPRGVGPSGLRVRPDSQRFAGVQVTPHS